MPQGGGLLIEGPLGFEFPNPCTPEARPSPLALSAFPRFPASPCFPLCPPFANPFAPRFATFCPPRFAPFALSEVAPSARGSTYQVEPMASKVLRCGGCRGLSYQAAEQHTASRPSLPTDVACSFQQTTGPAGRSIIRPLGSVDLVANVGYGCKLLRITAGTSGIMRSPKLAAA